MQNLRSAPELQVSQAVHAHIQLQKPRWTAVSDRDKLHGYHCPLWSVVHLLCSPCHQNFSRNRLSSKIVSHWVSCLSPMPLCCGQPLSYNILSSVSLWQSSPITPSEIASIRDSKKVFPWITVFSPPFLSDPLKGGFHRDEWPKGKWNDSLISGKTPRKF